MTPRPTLGPKRRQQPTTAEVVALHDRLDVIERRQQLLKRTVQALAGEAGVSMGCPCAHCQRSYTLVKNGTLSCPACGYRESL